MSAYIYLQTQTETILIRGTREVVGRELCMCLLFAHAMSGCDTNPALDDMVKSSI